MSKAAFVFTVSLIVFLAMFLVSFLPNTPLFIAIKALIGIALSGTAFFYVRESGKEDFVKEENITPLEVSAPEKHDKKALGPSVRSPLTVKSEQDAEADFDLFLQTIFPLIKQTIISESVVLLMVNYFKKQFYIRYTYSDNEHHFAEHPYFALNRGLPGRILKDKKPIVEKTLPPGDELLPYYASTNLAKSFIGTPLFFNDLMVGILCADSQIESAFSPEDLNLLQSFGGVINIQLATSNKLFEYESAHQGTRKLYDFTKDMLTISNINELWDYLGQALAGIFNADRVIIAEKSGQNLGKICKTSGSIPWTAADTDFPDNEGIIGWVLRKNQPLLVEDFSEKENYIPRFFINEPQDSSIKSLLAAPISLNGEVQTILSLESITENHFSEQDKKTLENLAGDIAPFIEKIKYIEVLKSDSQTDPETRVGNRKAAINYLTKEIERSREFNRPFAVQLFKLSPSSQTEDREIKRRLCREFLSFILPLVSASTYIFRLDQECFAILWPEKGIKRAVSQFQEIYAQALENKPWVDGIVEQIMIHCGFVQYPQMADTAELLLEKARKALNSAEQKGPNAIEVYNMAESVS